MNDVANQMKGASKMKHFNIWTRDKHSLDDKHVVVLAHSKVEAIVWGKRAAEEQGEHFIGAWEVKVKETPT